jgi:hypothetical protein
VVDTTDEDEEEEREEEADNEMPYIIRYSPGYSAHNPIERVWSWISAMSPHQPESDYEDGKYYTQHDTARRDTAQTIPHHVLSDICSLISGFCLLLADSCFLISTHAYVHTYTHPVQLTFNTQYKSTHTCIKQHNTTQHNTSQHNTA